MVTLEEIERELGYAIEDGRLDESEAKALMDDEEAARKWYAMQDLDPY